MKATLSFTLPEEEPEFRQAACAGRYSAALSDISEYLRGQERHIEAENRDSIIDARERFYEILAEFNLQDEGF